MLPSLCVIDMPACQGTASPPPLDMPSQLASLARSACSRTEVRGCPSLCLSSLPPCSLACSRGTVNPNVLIKEMPARTMVALTWHGKSPREAEVREKGVS